jgi:hypothetical protein
MRDDETTEMLVGRETIMPETATTPPVESRKKRHERLIQLLRKWASEDPAYDTSVMQHLRQATDITMRCREPDEDSA